MDDPTAVRLWSILCLVTLIGNDLWFPPTELPRASKFNFADEISLRELSIGILLEPTLSVNVNPREVSTGAKSFLRLGFPRRDCSHNALPNLLFTVDGTIGRRDSALAPARISFGE